MEHVSEDLIISVGMDGCHDPILHANPFVQNLRQGGQAVGGTRYVADDFMTGAQRLVVHAEHHGRVHVGAAGREMTTFFAPPAI